MSAQLDIIFTLAPKGCRPQFVLVFALAPKGWPRLEQLAPNPNRLPVPIGICLPLLLKVGAKASIHESVCWQYLTDKILHFINSIEDSYPDEKLPIFGGGQSKLWGCWKIQWCVKNVIEQVGIGRQTDIANRFGDLTVVISSCFHGFNVCVFDKPLGFDNSFHKP